MSTQDAGALAALARRADPADAGAQNNLGVVLLARGRPDGAAAAFSRALALDPRMTLARRNLDAAGGPAWRARRASELRARLRVDGGDVEARRELAALLADAGRLDDARREFDALIALLPGEPGPCVQRALCEQRAGDLDAAATWLARAIALDPAAALPRAHLGEVIYHRGEPARALSVLDEAIALAPDHADAHYVRGFVLGELGRPAEAEAATARALALNPALGRAHANLAAPGDSPPPTSAAAVQAGDRAVDVNLALGLALRQKGYYDEAVREYRRALARAGDDPTAVRALAELHLLRGAPEEAIPHWTRLVVIAPDDATAWHGLAVATHLAGRSDDAASAYRRAARVAGDRGADASRVLNDYGVFRAARGESEDASDLLAAAVAADAAHAPARLNLAQLLMALGRYERALAEYRGVLRDAPNDAAAWAGLGAVLAAAGRTAEARSALARALEADPSRADARYELGFLAAAAGDHATARREAEQAMLHAPLVARRSLSLAIDLGTGMPLSVSHAADAGTSDGGVVVRGFDIAGEALDALLGDVLAPETSAPVAHGPAEPSREFAVAEECLRAGLYDRAAAAVSASLARGADRAAGLVLLGHTFAAQGYLGEALERYQEARLAEPSSRAARLGELRTLRETGRLAAARDAAESFVADHPDHAEALAIAAVGRADAGDADGAADAIERATACAADADAWAAVAEAWRALGRRDGEADACRRALHAAPDRWRVRLALARALAAVGDAVGAERELAAIVERDAAHAEARVELAGLRAAAGDRAGARRQLVEVLAGDPLHLDALATLGALLLDDGRADDATVAVRRVLRFDAAHALAVALDGELAAHAGRVLDARARWTAAIALEPAGEGAARARRALARHAAAGADP